MHIKNTQEAIENFERNITYIQKEQPNLALLLAEYEEATEKKLYTPKYEIIHQDCYFDVLEATTQTKLYNSNSIDYAKEVAQSINFSKEQNIYETFKKRPLDREETKDISPLLHYIHDNIPDSKEFEKIEKFIFFGTGLGTHIQEVDAKISAGTYFIIEDDLELFRLSLFCTPYYKLAKNAILIFSVFEDSTRFKSSAQKFINAHFHQNQYLKFFPMRNHSEEKIKAFHIQVISQSQNLFFYNSILTQYIEPLKLIQKKYNFLNLLAPTEDSPLSKHPVIFLAAGPSLQKNIQLVKERQESFIVVALSSVLNTLEKHAIKPDIVTHMDGFEPSTQHFKKLQSLDFLDESIFFFSARSPKYIINLFDKKRIFFYENGTNFRSSMGNLSAACVGSTTYLLLLALGVKELYLIGLDLALNQETGLTHSSEHEFAKKLTLENKEDSDTVEFKKEVIEIEGNFRDKVFTTVEFQLSVESINAASSSFKKEEQMVYNLNDGAKFVNTLTLKTEMFSVQKYTQFSKKSLRKNIQEFLTQNATHLMSKEEKNLISEKTLYIHKLLKKIQSYKQKTSLEKKEFIQETVYLFSTLSQNSEKNIYDISLILQECLKYIFPFVYDFFNTKKLINETQHIANIQKKLADILEVTLQKYLEPIESLDAMV